MTDDIAGDTDATFFREWLSAPQATRAEGNCSDLKKVGDDIVIRWLFDEHFGTPEEVSLTISKKNLLEILESWKALYKKKPAKITIVKTDKGCSGQVKTYTKIKRTFHNLASAAGKAVFILLSTEKESLLLISPSKFAS